MHLDVASALQKTLHKKSYTKFNLFNTLSAKSRKQIKMALYLDQVSFKLYFEKYFAKQGILQMNITDYFKTSQKHILE